LSDSEGVKPLGGGAGGRPLVHATPFLLHACVNAGLSERTGSHKSGFIPSKCLLQTNEASCSPASSSLTAHVPLLHVLMSLSTYPPSYAVPSGTLARSQLHAVWYFQLTNL
jgi:hypothetical protein